MRSSARESGSKTNNYKKLLEMNVRGAFLTSLTYIYIFIYLHPKKSEQPIYTSGEGISVSSQTEGNICVRTQTHNGNSSLWVLIHHCVFNECRSMRGFRLLGEERKRRQGKGKKERKNDKKNERKEGRKKEGK